MKSYGYLVVFTTLLILSSSVMTDIEPEYDPVGKWNFSAPEAPYGYNSGIIEFKKNDDLYTGTLKFQDFDYIFECEKVEFKDDVISFILFLEDADVLISMSFTENDKLSGVAIHPDGEVYLTAKRVVEE